MSMRVEWQWQDAGSAAGHMQKVAIHQDDHVGESEFRRWIAHCAACTDCKFTEGCERSLALQQAYEAARRRAASYAHPARV